MLVDDMIEPSTAQQFFALLTVLALVGTVVLVVLRLAAHVSDGAAAIVHSVSAVRTPLAALVAVTATLGSLYFSEVANYVPCMFCWYQRIAMYPLAVILVIASFRRDDLRWYVVPIAGIGMAIAGYHRLLELYPTLDTGTCSAVGPPCTAVWSEEFGFITLAVMAFIGFAAIITLTTLPQETHHGDLDETPDQAATEAPLEIG